MRKFLTVAAAAICCAAALPAIAAPAADNAADQAGARPARQHRDTDPNRLICASARLSESRIPRRVCRSRAEWDAMRAEETGRGR